MGDCLPSIGFYKLTSEEIKKYLETGSNYIISYSLDNTSVSIFWAKLNKDYTWSKILNGKKSRKLNDNAQKLSVFMNFQYVSFIKNELTEDKEYVVVCKKSGEMQLETLKKGPDNVWLIKGSDGKWKEFEGVVIGARIPDVSDEKIKFSHMKFLAELQ